MAYFSNVKAEDVLLDSTVIVTLPASALAFDAVSKLLGLRQKAVQQLLQPVLSSTASKGTQIPSASRLVSVEVFNVSWDWNVEDREVYDDEGQVESVEFKKGYEIDSSAVGALSLIQQSVSSVLSSLGIPHDCKSFDSVEGVSNVERARMKPDQSTSSDSCHSWPVPDEIDISDVLNRAKKSSSLVDLTEWLEELTDHCPTLAGDCQRFNELLADPAHALFIEASANILDACLSPTHRWAREKKVKWQPELSTWIRHTLNSEDPLARFARCGLPLSGIKLEQLVDEACFEANPDEFFIVASISAYCAFNSQSLFPAGQRRATVHAATTVCKWLDSMPHLASKLSPAAKNFFDLELNAPDKNISGASFANIEAGWLRAQSLMVNSSARVSRRASL